MGDEHSGEGIYGYRSHDAKLSLSLYIYIYVYIYIYIYIRFGFEHMPYASLGSFWPNVNFRADYYGEARRQLHKSVESNIEQILAATPHKAPTIRPPTSHHENYPSQTQGRAHKWCTPMDLHMWPSKSRTTSSNIHAAALWGYGM